MEEAEGFARLLALEEPKYSSEQIAAKVGKHPSFVASRLKMNDLTKPVVDAFYVNEIGVGHALLLAKLPADQQQLALSACFKEVYNGSQSASRILLPVRNLQFWIETNVLLILKDAPFDKRDAQLVSAAGSCASSHVSLETWSTLFVLKIWIMRAGPPAKSEKRLGPSKRK